MRRTYRASPAASSTREPAARGVALGVEWEQVDVLVTDLDRDDERLAAFRAVVEMI